MLFIPLTSYTVFGQHTKRINGSIKSSSNDVSNVLIINLNSKRSTISDSLGLFTIEAKLRDSIRFTAIQYRTKEIVIAETIFQENSVSVSLMENVISLNEVVVMPYNLSGTIEQDMNNQDIEPVVSSLTLDLPFAGLKVMTKSERLLLVADRGKYGRFMTIEEKLKSKALLGFFKIGTIINSDKISNRVSGRTEVFKNRVASDANLALEKEILANFPKKTMSESFDIPETNIDAFLTYCMFQEDFLEFAETANMLAIWEYLKAKSIEFKETDSSKE